MTRGVGETPKRKLLLTPPARYWQACDILSLDCSKELTCILRSQCVCSMRLARNTGLAAADQKIEVAAPIRLQRMFDMQSLIPRQGGAQRRLPLRATPHQFGFLNP